MADTWLRKWDERFKENTFAYGTEPNAFLKNQLEKHAPGKILFAAEGEGRNAVFAAKNGWDVSAFDISVEGQRKAHKLANENKVSINYQVGQLPELDFNNESFDVIALIYAHFPPDIKPAYHKLLAKKLKIGGYIILEAFGENHLSYRNNNPKIGGPSNADALISVNELESYFKGFEILTSEEKEVALSEGLYHNGEGSVTRFVAKKIKA